MKRSMRILQLLKDSCQKTETSVNLSSDSTNNEEMSDSSNYNSGTDSNYTPSAHDTSSDESFLQENMNCPVILERNIQESTKDVDSTSRHISNKNNISCGEIISIESSSCNKNYPSKQDVVIHLNNNVLGDSNKNEIVIPNMKIPQKK
ncbi:dentin sialophosphoprotein-like [Galleria mellonella]|nr:dentin sialophosphoprotein-like [Galleria mellonella]